MKSFHLTNEHKIRIVIVEWICQSPCKSFLSQKKEFTKSSNLMVIKVVIANKKKDNYRYLIATSISWISSGFKKYENYAGNNEMKSFLKEHSYFFPAMFSRYFPTIKIPWNISRVFLLPQIWIVKLLRQKSRQKFSVKKTKKLVFPEK